MGVLATDVERTERESGGELQVTRARELVGECANERWSCRWSFEWRRRELRTTPAEEEENGARSIRSISWPIGQFQAL